MISKPAFDLVYCQGFSYFSPIHSETKLDLVYSHDWECLNVSVYIQRMHVPTAVKQNDSKNSNKIWCK